MKPSTSPTQKTKATKVEAQYWHAKGFLGLYSRVFLRTTQFVLSLLLIALYSPDLTNATSTNSRAQAPWIIAIIVCILSAATCIIHVFTTVKRVALVCVWDAILMVVWAAVTGTFGMIFIRNKDGKEAMSGFTSDKLRMKVAVWFDLVMMILWGVSALQGCVWCCVARKMTRGTVVPGKESQMVLDDEPGSVERREREEKRQQDDFERNGMLPEGMGNGSCDGGSRTNEDERAFVEDGQGLKKTESPPPPMYARFSV